MCRLLGYAAAHSTTLAELIGLEQCDSFRDMSRLHADGWGSAWIADAAAGSSIERVRDTIPAGHTGPIVNAMQDEAARGRIVHLRMASAGIPVNIENTHPFVAEGIAFAHNGAVLPITELRTLIEPELVATVDGATDSELYFALVRQHMSHGFPLFDAVCETVALLRSRFPKASLNALLLTDDEVIAVHSSENARIPLAEFEASGLPQAELPLGHLDNYYQMSYLRNAEGATVFASTGINSAGWTPLPPATIASVSLRTMELKTKSVLDGSVGSMR
jgi:predicted glutamine amidotransferase